MPKTDKLHLFNRLKNLIDLNGRKVTNNKYNQYKIIENLNDYLATKGFQHELHNNEKMGLCHGLSVYYGWMRHNQKQAQFFRQLTTIAEVKDVNALSTSEEMALEKVLNHMRWLHGSKQLLPDINQADVAKSISFISTNTSKPIAHTFGIAALFTEDEFNEILEGIQNTNGFICLSTGMHAMCAYYENSQFYLFEPDSEGLEEYKFNNASELYLWLLYQSIGYKNDVTADELPDYIALDVNIYTNKKLASAISPIHYMQKFRNDDNQFLARKNNKQMNALFLNCFANRPDVIRYLSQFDETKPFINLPVELGFTPLLYCCQAGYSDCVGLLLAADANPNLAAESNHTPLHAAIIRDDIVSVRRLLRSGANVNQPGTGNSLAITRAAQVGNVNIFLAILDEFEQQNGDIHSHGDELLQLAVTNHHLEIVRLLLVKNILVTSKSLEIAARNENIQILDLLLEAIKNINASVCENAIYSAASAGSTKAMSYLLKHPKTKKACQNSLEKALTSALLNNKYEAAKLIIIDYKISCHSGRAWLNCILQQPRAGELLNYQYEHLKQEVDILELDFNKLESLATWALDNKDKNQSESLNRCVASILKQLNNSHEKLMIANITLKIKKLRASLCDEETRMNHAHDSCLFYKYYSYRENKVRQKIYGLDDILIKLIDNPFQPIGDLVKEIEKKYPLFLSGFFLQREYDLIQYIASEQEHLGLEVKLTDVSKKNS